MDAKAARDDRSFRGRRSRVVLIPRRWNQASRLAMPAGKWGWQESPAHPGEHEGNR